MTKVNKKTKKTENISFLSFFLLLVFAYITHTYIIFAADFEHIFLCWIWVIVLLKKIYNFDYRKDRRFSNSGIPDPHSCKCGFEAFYPENRKHARLVYPLKPTKSIDQVSGFSKINYFTFSSSSYLKLLFPSVAFLPP